jgi:hypothetical protein
VVKDGASDCSVCQDRRCAWDRLPIGRIVSSFNHLLRVTGVVVLCTCEAEMLMEVMHERAITGARVRSLKSWRKSATRMRLSKCAHCSTSD